MAEDDVLICASGIINPRESAEEIRFANFTVPKLACSIARDHGAKAITLGTVLEDIVPKGKQNPYVQSKKSLANAAEKSWLHLQLHTVYGGHAPDRFMFLGQLFKALKDSQRFSMTSGEQLREYHHAEDVAKAILKVGAQTDTGCIDISHGEYITLRELAEEIFTHFDRLDYLGIGDLVSPEAEAFQPIHTRSPLLKDLQFKDTVPNVIEWLEFHLQGKSAE